MGRLEDYFAQHLASGYTYDQLAQQLRNEGYSDARIQKAYTTYQSQLYKTQLSQFIHEQIEQGAKPELLRDQLIGQGYDATLVTQLLYPHHKIEHHHLISFLVLLLVAVVGGIIFLTMSTPSPEALPLPVSSQTVPVQVLATTQIQEVPLNDNELFILAQEQDFSEEACLRITAADIRDVCLQEHALTTGVVRRCLALSTPKAQDDCYFAQISQGKQVDCSSFSLPENKMICQEYDLSST